MDRLGLKEGEVIQHSMITKSIERAQKKVEENNFATRKRLLEYDDVMNSQREVIYKRRKNALYGERLQFDIMNMLYDLCEDIAQINKETNNSDELRLQTISNLGIDFQISVEELQKTSEFVLAEKLYDEAYASYISKSQAIVNKILPLLKQLLKNRGAVVQNIMVPFTDGIKQIGVSVNLQESVNSRGLMIISEMEKIITVAIIDQLWKEHLRDMDDLKQSVQNAVYEQKDPLLIYKFEGFEMFKLFIGKVNQETMSLLVKSEIPIQNEHEVKEANQSKSSQKYQESKAETKSALSYQESNGKQVAKTAPIKTQKVASRNTRVSVKYTDGMVKKDIKYKLVEDDLKSNKCILID